MGLSVFVVNGDKSWESSYSNVDKMKEYLITATIKYLSDKIENEEKEKDVEDNNSDNNMLEYLYNMIKKWMDGKKINYEMIEKNMKDGYKYFTYLTYTDLLGLHWFVDHSFCDGTLSRGQCVDVYNMLEVIKKYLYEIGDENDDREWIDNFYDMFKNSVDIKSYVIFC